MKKEITKDKCEGKCGECPKIDKLTISFPNEDLNKLVEKLNEVINKNNER